MRPELERVEIGRLELIRTLRRVFGQQQGLSTAALAAMAGHLVGVRIPAGFELNDPSEQMADVYMITEGELATEYNGRLLHRFGPQSVVGLLSSLIRGARGFRCWATRETLALSWRADDMLEVFEDHFELLHSVLRALANDSVELRRQLPPHAGFSNVIRAGVEYPARPLDLVERLLCLRQTFGFQTSHIDELAELARAAVEARYAAGTLLWAAGESSDALLIMVSGVVSATTPEGLEFQLGPGDIVGSFGVVAGLPSWFTARVTQPAVTLSINREVLIDLLEDQPDLGFDFLQLMASALLELRIQIAALSANGPALRVSPAVP